VRDRNAFPLTLPQFSSVSLGHPFALADLFLFSRDRNSTFYGYRAHASSILRATPITKNAILHPLFIVEDFPLSGGKKIYFQRF